MVTFLSFNLSAQMEVNGNILYGNEWIDYDKTYTKLTVDEDGIYRVNRQDLADNGIPVSSISFDQIQIWNYGKEIRYFIGPNDSYIEFYGEKNRSQLDKFLYLNQDDLLNPEYSLVNDEAAYFITWGNESNNEFAYNEVISDLSNNTISPEGYYMHEHKEVLSNAHYKPVLDGSLVRFSNLVASEGYCSGLRVINSISADLQSVADIGLGGQASIIYGGNGSGTQHNSEISINGNILDTVSSSSSATVRKEYDINSEIISSGQVSLSIKGIASSVDKNVISYLKVTYPRTFSINDVESLMLTFEPSTSSRYIELTDYNESELPFLLNMTSGQKILPERLDGDKLGFILDPSEDDVQVYFAKPETIKSPISLSERVFTNYLNSEYDYLLLSSTKLRNEGNVDWIQEYADYRASEDGGGYSPVVLDIEQLYDQFAYGVDRHFISMRNYGFWAKENYDEPKFMFIIGKGREYTRTRSEYLMSSVTEYYVPTWGFPASDNLILSDNEIPVPIFPIGRLAAKNATEVEEYLQKVIDYDRNKNNPSTIEDRLWQKRVLHLSGGDDVGLQEALARNLDQMGDTLTNNLYGAEVTTFYKRSLEAIEIATSEKIFELINDGLGLITFFGHSSVGTFDFSLDNIDFYENVGRYPLFMSLGCHSGNIHTDAEGISERFVVSENKGAVAFIAASGTAYVSQQNQYAKKFYSRIGGVNYGAEIGTALNNTITDFSNNTSYSYISFLQQLTMHGDPALKLTSYDSPDLITDANSVRTNPTFVDTYEDEFELCFDIANLGRTSRDSFDVKVEHLNPKGEVVSESIIRTTVPFFKEEYCIKIPLNANGLVGRNIINITLDINDEIEEGPEGQGESNNELVSVDGSLGFVFYILNNSALPVYPENFSIVNENSVSLVASTYNAFGEEQMFYIQVDTTNRFDSPGLRENVINNVRGVVEWELDFVMEPKTVYYWRVSPDSTTTGVGFVWESSSFVYDPPARDGWNQSHFYQYEDDEYTNMFLDEVFRDFFFAKNLTQISIINKVWENGSPATFTIDNSTKGSMMKREADPSLGVVVVDSLGKFVMNAEGGEFGSDNYSNKAIRTFYFKMDNQESRSAFVDFLDTQIPDRYYVCIYTVQQSVNTDWKIPEWDEELFAALEDEGALDFREFQTGGVALPYGFVYRKGVSPLAEGIAEDINSQVEISEGVPGFWFEGMLRSDFIGPAQSWDEFVWSIDEETKLDTDTVYVNVYGYDLDKKNEQLIFEKEEAQSIDLSALDAVEFPYLKIEYYANDITNVSPVQLTDWRVYYKSIGDLAINTSESYTFYADSLDQGDNFSINYNISNFTDADVEPTKIRYTFTDSQNGTIIEDRDVPQILKGSSLPVTFDYSTENMLGDYQVTIQLNPDRNPNEKYYFNNFGASEFKVKPDLINPVMQVTFDGVQIMNEDIVSATPLIRVELTDENEYLLLNDPDDFTLLLEYPDGSILEVSKDDPNISFFPATEEGNNTASLEYNPELIQDGTYILRIDATDKSSNASGAKNYEVEFRVFNEEMISNVFNYPNPFSTSTQFIFTLTGNEDPGNVLIRVMTLSGKVVREITMAELGSLKLGINKTDYKWDGTDDFGEKLANGVYLYQVITKKLDGSDYKKFNDDRVNNTDYLFKEGFGKLVIMR